MSRKPKYAVIALGENVDVGSFFNLLIANGYNNVTFLSNLADHSEVKKLLRNDTKRTETPVKSVNSESFSSKPIKIVNAESFSSKTIKIGDIEATLMIEPKTPEIITVSATANVIPSTSVELPQNNGLFFESEIRSTRQNADLTNCISCKLCDNKIMVTRLSNLTNHVRRHSSVKQYSCPYCPYQHNESSKVRTHMAGQHGDTITNPNDNLTPELQKIWCAYMEKCFPGYLDSQGKVGKHALDVFGGRSLARLEGAANTLVDIISFADKLHNCVECGDAVSRDGDSNEQFTEHIFLKHADVCQPYKCGECGWLAAYEYTVRGHIASKHAIIAADVSVSVQETCDDFSLFVGKFFPSLEEHETVAGISEELQAFVENQNKSEDYMMEKMAGTTAERTEEESSNVECSMCSSIFPISGIEAMMAHSKEHYAIKQFECPFCPFGSNYFDEVDLHLASIHEESGTVIDQNTDVMQQAWLTTMKHCFPDLLAASKTDPNTDKPLKKKARHS